MAQFDAEVKQTEYSNWPVTWQKKTGDITADIKTRDGKFNESTNRRLLIHSVCKDDEAKYQAVISNGNNNYISSNAIYLHVHGGIILLCRIYVGFSLLTGQTTTYCSKIYLTR